MPTFFQGFMMTVTVFAFCAMLAIIIRLAILWRRYVNEPKPEAKPETKVYYVNNSAPVKKKKRRKRKSPDLAFKGIVLTPEQIKIIESGKTNANQDQKHNA